MLHYLGIRAKMNLPSILFRYLREMIKETKDNDYKPKKLIPIGRLIFDISVESLLVNALEDVGFTEDIHTDVGKLFNGKFTSYKNIFKLKKNIYL